MATTTYDTSLPFPSLPHPHLANSPAPQCNVVRAGGKKERKEEGRRKEGRKEGREKKKGKERKTFFWREGVAGGREGGREGMTLR